MTANYFRTLLVPTFMGIFLNVCLKQDHTDAITANTAGTTHTQISKNPCKQAKVDPDNTKVLFFYFFKA
jgi:hypothetical protein